MTKKLQINIFTPDLVWVGAIDAVESLVHRTSWVEIPQSELSVSRKAQGVEELQVGRILVVNNQRDKALIIEDMSASLNSNYINYNCISLKGLLNYRICNPTDVSNFSKRTQAEVMKLIVYNNVITQTRDTNRRFWDSTGTKDLLGVAAIQALGETIDFSIDWDTGYMGDTLVNVAKMNTESQKPLGWSIYIKPDFTMYELDVYQGLNKHINQTALPPVVFSEEFGNVKDASYEYSIKDWRNLAFMIWENGTTKTNTIVTNPSRGMTRGFNRKEVIINSSKKTSSEVAAEGRSELNKRPHVESFTAEIINNDRTMSTYGVDWNIGDIVTVQSKAVLKDTKISIDAQITEIEEVYASGEYTINATFGEGKLSLIQLIKNSINQK